MEYRWIKLWASLKHNKIWENPEYLKGWLYILFSASHEKQIIDGRILPVGSFLTSQHRIAKECQMSRQRVRTFLKFLEKEGMIKTLLKKDLEIAKNELTKKLTKELTKESTKPYYKDPTILLIPNYLKFQRKTKEKRENGILRGRESTKRTTKRATKYLTIFKKYRKYRSIYKRGTPIEQTRKGNSSDIPLVELMRLIDDKLHAYDITQEEFKRAGGSASNFMSWFQSVKEAKNYTYKSDFGAIRAWGLVSYLKTEIIPALRHRREGGKKETKISRNLKVIEAVTGVPLSNSNRRISYE